MTGKTILLDNKVQGKITIISASEVTPDEALDPLQEGPGRLSVWHLLLRRHLTASCQLNEINKTGPVYRGPPPAQEGFSVAVVLLKVANAEQVANTIKPMVTVNGSSPGPYKYRQRHHHLGRFPPTCVVCSRS